MTPAYVAASGEALGIKTLFQWRTGGFEGELLRNNEPTKSVKFENLSGEVVELPSLRSKPNTRRQFPQVSADLRVRWCSGALKIDVSAKVINNEPRFVGKKILYVSGERRQEGGGRKFYLEAEAHRCSSSKKQVDHYRPVIDWSEQQVWDIIKKWRINVHPAYKLGWGRLSCCACIFGNADQWASIRELDANKFNRIAKYEIEFGKTIQRNESIVEQADRGKSIIDDASEALKQKALGKEFSASEFFLADGEEWYVPTGAFKSCGGPT